MSATLERYIDIQSVSKRYGEFPALAGLSIQVPKGEVLGLLGPNGAGKSTLLRVLMGILVPTSGRALIAGLDCQADRVELKRLIGYVPDVPLFYDYLSGRELLRFVGEMHGLPKRDAGQRGEQLLHELGLSAAADDYVVDYSLGMKKRMSLALALVHEPPILILDEPTTGLDPVATRALRTLVRESAERGRTVILSTHWLDFAQELCDRVAVIHRGALRALGAPSDLCLRVQPSARGGRAASLEDVFFAITGLQPKFSPPPR